MGDWYYIGHYGQLGPLTREQIDELVTGGVISRDTYVWFTGMSDWLPAERCIELKNAFVSTAPTSPPPPPSPRYDPVPVAAPPKSYGLETPTLYTNYQPVFAAVRSDRSRALGGILNLILPGIGRMYLGYVAIGVLQLLLCGPVGWIWSIIDGIIILTGGLKLDGYGRELPD